MGWWVAWWCAEGLAVTLALVDWGLRRRLHTPLHASQTSQCAGDLLRRSSFVSTREPTLACVRHSRALVSVSLPSLLCASSG